MPLDAENRPQVSLIILLGTTIVSLFVDWMIFRAVLKRISDDQTAARRRLGRNILNASIVASVAIAIIGTIFYVHSLPGPNADLANSPQALRKAATEQVIQSALANPTSPWAWHELQDRNRQGKITDQQCREIVNGLTAWIRQKYPNGCDQPLFWMDG